MNAALAELVSDAELFLHRLAAGAAIDRPVALVVAHPDDEVLGLGSRLACLGNLTLIHLTDGAPRDLRDARRAGMATREDYAALRRAELDRALALAGARPARRIASGVADQEAAYELVGLTESLAGVLAGVEIVVTHAYEGGHPDHDAAAFAVQSACALLDRDGRVAPARVEFASYHARDGELATEAFWPAPGCAEMVLALTEEERRAKRRALAAFGSQRPVIDWFPIGVESLRPAPEYDFAAPPPPGEALYDRFGWPITSALWRAEAAGALAALGLDERS